MRLLLACTLLGATLCLAQTVTQPAFEVAAIKPSTAPDGSSSWHSRNGRITMDNMNVRQIILAAYGIREYQLAGGPGWLTAERFHIDAKAEGKVQDDQLMPMLQTLLGDRFKLAVHREKKEMTAYALVQAKGGLKIQPVEGTGSSTNSRGGKLTAKHTSMARLAEFLSRTLDRPCVDETGAPGGYDFTLEYSTERMQKAAEADGGVPAGPTLFTALPEQLGLKLEARKVPVEIVVIDRVERPSDN